MNTCRLLCDDGFPGAWNMAVDEVLLESAAQQGVLSLRFYQWNAPTLSLGYFQALVDRGLHDASRNCQVVRRASGGGAILHHHELTYSFATTLGTRFSAEANQYYRLFHQTLVELLDELGCSAHLAPAPLRGNDANTFLCFQRRGDGDVLIGEHKVLGSAQRRQQSALLQHGSVLLRRSPFAPELSGICDIGRVDLDAATLARRWSVQLADRLQLPMAAGELTLSERRRAGELVASRYGDGRWLERR